MQKTEGEACDHDWQRIGDENFDLDTPFVPVQCTKCGKTMRADPVATIYSMVLLLVIAGLLWFFLRCCC